MLRSAMAASRLTARRGNGPRAVLTPIGPDEFLYEGGFDRLKLERDEAGRVRGARFFARGEGKGVVGARTDGVPATAPAALQLPRAALERLVGEYVQGPRTMNVFLDGERLKAQLAGQEPVTLKPASATRFDVAETDATVTFTAGDAPAGEATISHCGREMVLTRTP